MSFRIEEKLFIKKENLVEFKEFLQGIFLNAILTPRKGGQGHCANTNPLHINWLICV